MRNDLTKHTGTACAYIDDLRAEIVELRAVVDPLEAILKLQRVVIEDQKDHFQAWANGHVRSAKTLADVLHFLRDALKPPEPKWTVAGGSTDQKSESEAVAFAKQLSETIGSYIPVYRDGVPVCVYIGGERFNRESEAT